MRGAQGERRQGSIYNIHAGLNGLEEGHGSHARCVVGMQLYRYLQLPLEGLDKRVGVLGSHQAGHVLDTQAVRPHLLKGDRLLDEVVQVVNIPAHPGLNEGIAQAELGMFAAFLDGHQGCFKVALVVQGVKYAEDVHAGFGGVMDKGGDDIISVVAVADQVLPPQQHLKGGVRRQLLYFAQPLPGVFVQKTGGYVKGGPAPDLQGIKTGLVHLRRYGQHVLGAHAGGQQGLMPVAQGDIGYLEPVLFHCYSSSASACPTASLSTSR